MYKFFIVFFLILLSKVSISQCFEPKTDVVKDAKQITIYNYNKGLVSGYISKTKYFLNEQGKVIKSKHYIKNRFSNIRNFKSFIEFIKPRLNYGSFLRYETKYLYNNKGLLSHVIKSQLINTKSSNGYDTTFYFYEFDIKGNIIKQYINKKYGIEKENYYDFNNFNKPLKSISLYKNDSIISIYTYDSLGNISTIGIQKNNSFYISEIRKYDHNNNLVYSLLPTFKNGNEATIICLGTSGRAPEEKYEYVYDKKNRITKTYQSNSLIEKRKYKNR